MGRAFEFRKARKIKRWSAMAKTFTESDALETPRVIVNPARTGRIFVAHKCCQ